MSKSENEKRYVNIALVGHVANGKTTLVERLTGVCTKRDSAEQKSGRTIKLGYANCLVWKCSICGDVFTTGQAQKTKECCSFSMEPAQYISFVDVPGHHSYIHTAIKGATVVDAAIVVTDVRQNKLQVQTMEHLAILEVLGVKNIIVVQNKVDLVGDKECHQHYEMLQQELAQTVAEGAPIVPISAQSGVGLEHVQKYIYRMVENTLANMREFKHNVFAIIRSFDINKPYTEINEIKGGVLGGTVRGEKGYKVGDSIQIRPGKITGKNSYHILETEIQTIFSERTKCKDMARGGLYGVGTKLDPSLTKGDRLVGCLAGRPEDLPDVVTEIEMKVVKMKLSESKTKISKGQTYNLIIGNNIVKGVARKNKLRKTWTMELSHPICTVERRCLIYSTSFTLIGFGMFDFLSPLTTEKLNKYIQCCGEGKRESKEDTTFFPPSIFTEEDVEEIRAYPTHYEDCQTVGKALDKIYLRQISAEKSGTLCVRKVGEWLDMLVFGRESRIVCRQKDYQQLLPGVEKVERKKITIPVPQMMRENRNMIWGNMEMFCQTVQRDPNQVCTYIKQELCMDVAICQVGLGNALRLFKTRLNEVKLQTVLRKFIIEQVVCDQCHGIDTTTTGRSKKVIQIHCHACGSNRNATCT